MPLTLEQYATYLDGRDLPWPAPPAVKPKRAVPHLKRLPEVRAVLWNVYGTLPAIPPAGELLFEHPQQFVMDVALEKTIAEFKMWGAMSRKPGQPSEYMGQIYRQFLTEQQMAGSGPEKHPEVIAEKIWEQVETWTKARWEAAKKEWAKDTTKWANCQKQWNKHKHEGRKSWPSVYQCMTG